MSEVLLSGGPSDGKRIAVRDGTSNVTVAFSKPMPFPLPPEPRPRWWQHPMRWLRWKPPPPPPMPEITQLVYRDTGKVSGGACVFEIDGDWPWFKGPEAAGDGSNLYRSLAIAWGTAHPMIRQDQGTRWIMSPDWYMRVRAMPSSEHADPNPHDYLFGVPVTVTDDGGAPHIENRRYPADF